MAQASHATKPRYPHNKDPDLERELFNFEPLPRMVGFEVWDPESSYVPWRKLTETYIGAILGLYRDNGKENGNYYSIIGYILGLYRATCGALLVQGQAPGAWVCW